MGSMSYPCGRIPIGGAQNQVSITAVQSIIRPTGAQRSSTDTILGTTLGTVARKGFYSAPVLEMWMTLEAQNARVTTDGTTPSGTNGHLLTFGSAGPFIWLGEELISAIKIISPVAGGLISYSFYFMAAL